MGEILGLGIQVVQKLMIEKLWVQILASDTIWIVLLCLNTENKQKEAGAGNGPYKTTTMDT